MNAIMIMLANTIFTLVEMSYLLINTVDKIFPKLGSIVKAVNHLGWLVHHF